MNEGRSRINLLVDAAFLVGACCLVLVLALQCGKDYQPPVVDPLFLKAELKGVVNHTREVKGGVIFRLTGSADTWFVECALNGETQLLCTELEIGDSVFKFGGSRSITVRRRGVAMEWTVFEAEWAGRHKTHP
jgi:hypothetical protein